jgi:hypothetical protein
VIQKLGQFVPVKQNTDKEGRRTGTMYKIDLLPTLMVLDASGNVILKHEGYLDAKSLSAFLKDARRMASKTKR